MSKLLILISMPTVRIRDRIVGVVYGNLSRQCLYRYLGLVYWIDSLGEIISIAYLHRSLLLFFDQQDRRRELRKA